MALQEVGKRVYLVEEVYVNVIRHGEHVLVAACDAELLGKTLKHGKINFEVKTSFYGGTRACLEEAIELIRNATTANLIGLKIVEKAVKEGLVHPEAILLISGVPHAQIVRL